jgi:murein DD-endopeptidase MepM/ murein hydrolase activator NlpD
MMSTPGPSSGPDRRTLPGGRRAIIYVWVGFDSPASAPTSVRHRLTVGELTLDSEAVTVSTQKPIVIGPPLSGDGWMAANGPGPNSGHRRALIPIDGGAHIAQRFAIDWVQIGPSGATFTGDQKANASYRAHGANVLAVADATVAAVKDGIPENIPGPASRAVPITAETIGGNYIVLDLGGGRFAFYAHLQPGSLRVKVGDRVTRGQVIGLVGNSGNSTEPHLHFHVSDGVSPLGSEGLPYAIAGMTGMPLQNARVNFGT